MARTVIRIAVACLALSAGGTLAAEPTATIVEYFNTVLGHYFMSADAAEQRSVESGGAGAGWIRTGGTFNVFSHPGDAVGLSPVCRFYGTPGIGPNSHFYTADRAECEAVKLDRGWLYEGVAFYIAEAAGGRCGAGSTAVYRSYNNGFARNDSNHRFSVDATVFAKSSASGYSPEGVVMCAPLSAADIEADALRLLRQATFGPTESEIARVRDMGTAAWIDEQLALAPTQYPAYAWMPANRPDTCIDDRTQPLRPDSFCARDSYTLFPLQTQFYRNALAQPDQLRARVAFALSQIMVASGVDNARNYAMRHYQQIFLDRAFGNFHDLLAAVTLSPVMGDYLDMVNNNKSSVAAGTNPNENYAREVLQLFSVGTYLLNADGTRKLDDGGRPRFTYDSAEIKGFARTFTGWTYPTQPGAAARNNNPRNYLGTMLAVDANHETGTKLLLNGVVAPAGLSMAQDLEFAHSNIVGHPNVAPFIGKQLIQKLVTAQPSPQYVSRVSAVWENNGAGQRGDLRAVVRAILLDAEARGARKIDPAYGKLVEPVLYQASLMRAFNGASDGVYLRAQSAALGQFLFYPATVFNYYPFDYVVPGTSLPGPEFGIHTSTTAIARANFATALFFSSQVNPDPTVFGAIGTRLDLAPYQAVASDSTALIARLDRFLLAGTMPASMRSAIVNALNVLAPTDTLNRARTAAWLVMTSPHYQVQR
jgi:uncharacterized protein (DUF1800 family)